MPRGRRSKLPLLTAALWVNAVLLGGILVAVIGRGSGNGSPWFTQEAFAQQAMPPIAGGGGLFFMPGQIQPNTFGVYVLDVDRQTMMVYFIEDKNLRLAAARDIRFDRSLRMFNTDPHPDTIEEILANEADDVRVNQSGENAARSTAEDPNASPDSSPDNAGDEPND